MNLGEDTFQASHQPTLHVTRPTSCLGKITLSIGNLLCTGVQLTLCLCLLFVVITWILRKDLISFHLIPNTVPI